MRFYKQQHKFYCGVDLHTKQMYCCIVDSEGKTLSHINIPTQPERFLSVVKPYRDDLVVAAECIFSWYWLADLCLDEGITFVLGHALAMKAIHGGKVKNDKIDSEKIAMLLRGGMLPQAYVYPQQMRATRDLLRRRMHFMHHRAETLAHIQNTYHQNNLTAPTKKLWYAANRVGIDQHFTGGVQKMVAADMRLIDHFDQQLRELELYLERHAKVDDPHTFFLLKSVPGIGKILGLVMLYEIHDINRFPSVGQFLSYARLVRCTHESAGKRTGFGSKKMGNAHLKWAFGEAVCLLMRQSPKAKTFVERKAKKHGKGKAMGILSAKLGRAVYFMLKRKEPFNEKRFLN